MECQDGATHQIGAVASCLVDAYRGAGPVGLGRRRSLAVLAVDGLGFDVAATTLAPDILHRMATTFPSTTSTALVTSLTGWTPSEHGVIGVRYLHPDGRQCYDCVTGELLAGSGPGGRAPGPDPSFTTVFQRLARLGVSSHSLPAELSLVRGAWVAAMLAGSRVHRDGSGNGDVDSIVDRVATRVTSVLDGHPDTVVWAYLNLDDHLHRHGPDRHIDRAGRTIDALARRLARSGTAVLLYADHGCVPSRPSPATMAAWDELASPRHCRIPAGGAGRVRWLYPHPGTASRLADRVRVRLPGVTVTSPAGLVARGLIEPGGPGTARIGEVVVLPAGPDFPVPDPSLPFEHGGPSEAEAHVPLAIWSP